MLKDLSNAPLEWSLEGVETGVYDLSSFEGITELAWRLAEWMGKWLVSLAQWLYAWGSEFAWQVWNLLMLGRH